MTFKTNLYLATVAGALAFGAAATAQTAPAAPAAPAAAPASNPTVGGAVMDATKPIATNAAAAPNLTTLVSAVKAAGLATTLAGPGPFTVFAPTNDAFSRLAPGTVDTLLKPEHKATLAKVLTYHVVPGTLTLADIQAKVTAGGGKAVLTTVEGEPLTIELVGGGVQLTDVNGNKSYIETPDVAQSNGVVHVVNGVLSPKLG
ncbi:MAG: fasciclin domain-containing protein [Pseudomonadota bacterium]